MVMRPLFDVPELQARAILSDASIRARIEAALRAEDAALRRGLPEPEAADVWADIDPEVAAVMQRTLSHPVGGRPLGSKGRKPAAKPLSLV